MVIKLEITRYDEFFLGQQRMLTRDVFAVANFLVKLVSPDA